MTWLSAEGGGAASFLLGRGAQSRWLGQAAAAPGQPLRSPFGPWGLMLAPKAALLLPELGTCLFEAAALSPRRWSVGRVKVRAALQPAISEVSKAVPTALDTQNQIQTDRRSRHLSSAARAHHHLLLGGSCALHPTSPLRPRLRLGRLMNIYMARTWCPPSAGRANRQERGGVSALPRLGLP